MKTKTNRFLSIFMILTILASLLTSLTMTVSAENYPGGTLFYETFTGYSTASENLYGGNTSNYYNLPANQPSGTTNAYAYRKKVGTVSEPGYGTVAAQNGNSTTHVSFNFPAAYTGYQTDTSLLEAQGPNAQLTLEFDFKANMDDTALAACTDILHWTLIGNDSLNGTGSSYRKNSAAVMYFKAPRTVNIYYRSGSTPYSFTLPEGVEFNDWHHYTLTMNLTDENKAGLKTYSFLVDGQNMTYVDDDNKTRDTAKLSYLTDSAIAAVSKVQLHTQESYVTYLDNVSLYKTTLDNPALSIAGLVSAVNTAYANMNSYDYATNGANSAQLEAFNNAYNTAVGLVTTAFGTYDKNGAEVNAAKTQTEVDTVLASLTAAEDALKTYLAGVTYPGGMYFYEPFDGIPKTQPEGTSLSTTDLEGYNPTTTAEEPEQVIEAVTDLPGSTAALKNKANWLNTIVNFPAAYNADGHDGTSAVDAYAKEGKDAKLVIEYDIKTTGNAENAEDGTELFIMVGSKGMTSGAAAREVAAAAYALNLPDSTHTSSYVDAYRKRNSSDEKTGVKFDLTKWQHHKLTIDLTSATAGLARYSLEVDGEVIVQNQQSPGHDSNSTKAYAIEELKMYTINENINVHLANLSVYKINEDNPAFSPAALSVLLRDVDSKMDVYEASGEDLTALNTAYSAAVTALNASYTTAQTDAVKAQAEINNALTALETAENDLIEVLSPYYVSGLITNEENENSLTGVTVQEIKEAADVNAKMIIATYDENGMVAAQIQAVTAGENTLTSSMDITGKTVKVFIWDMSESALLDYLADVYTFENVVTE